MHMFCIAFIAQTLPFINVIQTEVGAVLRSRTKVNVEVPECTLLQVKVLHSKCYSSKSRKVLASKYT